MIDRTKGDSFGIDVGKAAARGDTGNMRDYTESADRLRQGLDTPETPVDVNRLLALDLTKE